MVSRDGRDKLAVFAYGSLLSDPGQTLAGHIVARVVRSSPWPIEYARRAKLRGDGPTLVIHPAGGRVQGQLLVLDLGVEAIEQVAEWLWLREGKPPRQGIKRMAWEGFGQVLYCDLESTLSEAELNPESLARFAIESVRRQPARNAVRYLANNISRGVITPLTHAYRDAVLRLAGAKNLDQAEKFILHSEP
jgi:hypothetical protein